MTLPMLVRQAERDKQARKRVEVEQLFDQLRVEAAFGPRSACCGAPVRAEDCFATGAFYEKHRKTGVKACEGARRCVALKQAELKALRKEQNNGKL